MKSNDYLKDGILNAYNDLKKEDYINNTMWFLGMYLNIYNLYETYMNALFDSFVDIICGDNGDYSIINLPLKFISDKLDPNKDKFKFMFDCHLRESSSNVKPAKELVSKIMSNFRFNHFGRDKANNKMINKLNIILSERDIFGEESGSWFSELRIKNQLSKNDDIILGSRSETILVHSFFEDYSKSVRHELAHNFIQDDKMEDIKNSYPIRETIGMFEDSINRIDNQFYKLYKTHVLYKDEVNILENY